MGYDAELLSEHRFNSYRRSRFWKTRKPDPALDSLRKYFDDLKRRRILDSTPGPNLARVPGEIRNQIYGYLNFFGGVVCLHCPGAKGVTDFERLHKPAITRVCRKLRAETLPLYYSDNRFDMTCCWDLGHTDCATAHGGIGTLQRRWFESIAPHWEHLCDVKLRLPGWPSWTRFSAETTGMLFVMNGLPLSKQRMRLLQLLCASYIHSPTKLGCPFWFESELAYFLRDLSGIVQRIEKSAVAVTHSSLESPQCFLEPFGGFEMLQVSPISQPGQMKNEFLDWDSLVRDVEPFIHPAGTPGALLWRKETT